MQSKQRVRVTKILIDSQHYGNGTSVKRCFQPNANERSKFQCKKEFIINPDNEYTVVHGRTLTLAKKGKESTQVYPQKVSLKLRIGIFS